MAKCKDFFLQTCIGQHYIAVLSFLEQQIPRNLRMQNKAVKVQEWIKHARLGMQTLHVWLV